MSHLRQIILHEQLKPLAVNCCGNIYVPSSLISLHVPNPVAAWVCGCALAGIAGSNSEGGMDVCRECCVLSGRVFWVGLITRPE